MTKAPLCYLLATETCLCATTNGKICGIGEKQHGQLTQTVLYLHQTTQFHTLQDYANQSTKKNCNLTVFKRATSLSFTRLF